MPATSTTANWTPVALLIKLTIEHAGCNVCGVHDEDVLPITYTLHEIAADGSERENGLIYCAACAAKHGHRKALVAALGALETEMLRVDAEEGTAKDQAHTKAEMAHLRGLIASGKLTAPPPIPVECFARMAS